MVVALFGLSLLMIVGGVAAVVQGFPYVRLESGLAMVIGGSTAASAGVILLGLAAVVQRLHRLQTALGAPHEAGGPANTAPTDPALRPPLPLAAVPAFEPAAVPIVMPPPTPVSSPISAPMPAPAREREPGAYIEPVLPAEPTGVRPVSPEQDLFAPSRSGIASTPSQNREAEAREPVAPPVTDVTPPRETVPTLDLPLQTARETVSETASAAAPDRQDAQADAQTEAPGEARERVVVGTYASGGNTYAMFADGSIEAETPRGRFTFGSLKELKAFVDAGGENNARGAA